MAKKIARPFFARRVGTVPGLPSHSSLMAKKPKIQWFARQWRKHAGLNLERAADRLGMSVGYLSDLEKGKKRFNQDHLEAMAEAYGCSPASLLMRDPSDPENLWSLWDDIAVNDRAKVAKVLEAFKKTGTDD